MSTIPTTPSSTGISDTTTPPASESTSRGRPTTSKVDTLGNKVTPVKSGQLKKPSNVTGSSSSSRVSIAGTTNKPSSASNVKATPQTTSKPSKPASTAPSSGASAGPSTTKTPTKPTAIVRKVSTGVPATSSVIPRPKPVSSKPASVSATKPITTPGGPPIKSNSLRQSAIGRGNPSSSSSATSKRLSAPSTPLKRKISSSGIPVKKNNGGVVQPTKPDVDVSKPVELVGDRTEAASVQDQPSTDVTSKDEVREQKVDVNLNDAVEDPFPELEKSSIGQSDDISNSTSTPAGIEKLHGDNENVPTPSVQSESLVASVQVPEHEVDLALSEAMGNQQSCPGSEKLFIDPSGDRDGNRSPIPDAGVEMEPIQPETDVEKPNDGDSRDAPTPTTLESNIALPVAELISTSIPIVETATEEPIRVPAQAYPWAYMATTLEACFDSSESKPTKDDKPGENGVEEPDANGSDLSDLPPERDIEFYDSFTSIPFAKDAPRLMQLFHSHGDACEQAESEALKLAMRPASEIDVDDDQPMKPYYDALDGLDKLHDEAIELEASILRIVTYEKPAPLNLPPVNLPDDAESGQPIEKDETAANSDNIKETTDTKDGSDGDKHDSNSDGDDNNDNDTEEDDENPESNVELESANAQLVRVFAACLPILKARKANITMAQELLDSAQENLSISLRMESLGL